MRLGGGHGFHFGTPHMGGGGGRHAGLPLAVHVLAIFFLIVMGTALAVFAQIAVRDFVERSYGRTYSGVAGQAAAVFVAVAIIFSILKILRF
jgi:hypothetical protein